MKRILTILLIFFCISNSSYGATSKKITPALSDEQISTINTTIDSIYKKIYGGAFLSPSDSSNLIGIKIKLDDSMLVYPDTKYAPLYYKLGNIYKMRGNKQEAIECYQAIIENFSDTYIAPKAANQLNNMGIKVLLPKKQKEEDEE